MTDKAQETQAAPEANPQLDYTAVREAAEKKFVERLRGLHHLLKISKGAGTPTLTEISELHSSAFALLRAQQIEVQEMNKQLSTMIIQTSLRLDTITNILKKKDVIVSDEEFQQEADTILEEQRAKLAEAREQALSESLEQAKATKQP
jgi:hypothetical protein